MKTKISSLCLLIGLSLCSKTNAYTPYIFTPTWFKSIYQATSENKKNVWRGLVTEYNGGTSITVKNLDGYTTEVNLIHLTNKKNSNLNDIQIGSNYLQRLVGSQVYVLGKYNKDSVNAKILDAKGHDLNLNLIKIGVFDLNTTTLLGKPEKEKYLDASNEAKIYRRGIWN